MSRTFAYCRVSTTEQTTENQIAAIRQRGYEIEPHRVIAETISGSSHASQRPGFSKLIERMEPGDTLIVLKIDRLGRDAIDVLSTVRNLLSVGIKVISLDLPVPNLSSSEGTMMLQMFMAFAEFERNRIIERTKEGLARAKANGKKLGRPGADKTTGKVLAAKAEGLTQAAAAAQLGIGIATVKRHWNKDKNEAVYGAF